MAMRIRAVWGQAKPLDSARPSDVTKIRQTNKGPSESPRFQLMKVFYDKDEWRKRNETMRAAMTPDMVSLLTVPGYDIMEN
jgi:hypothetical protein